MSDEKHKVQNLISLEITGRMLVLRMPKNDADIQFVQSFKYARWDASNRTWMIPQYKQNLEVLKGYFGERLQSIKVLEQLDVAVSPGEKRTIDRGVLLVVQTRANRLRVIAAYNEVLTQSVRTIPMARWDSKNKWWSLPVSEGILQQLQAIAKGQNLTFKMEEEPAEVERRARITPFDVPNYRACPDEYVEKLKEMRYSEQTLRTYKSLFEEFINYYHKLDIQTIDERQIVAFLRYLVFERKVSSSYQNQSINAIKFYYERVLGCQRKIYLIDRPKVEKSLPVVLSLEEVKLVLKATVNLKHRAILTTIYSAGLRVSEAIHLKLTDIDSSRMQIRVVQSKGKKDRYTLLSGKTLDLLRLYFKEYKPKEYLFEGRPGIPYTNRSIQEVLKMSVRKAGITKHVTVHTLRHSFATHLLENGTGLRYIQSLLGHESSKTTEIYTHITTRGFEKIKSPLELMDD